MIWTSRDVCTSLFKTLSESESYVCVEVSLSEFYDNNKGQLFHLICYDTK